MRPSRRILLSLHAIFIFLLIVTAGRPACAQDSGLQANRLPPKWNDAVRALAERIASAAGSSHEISLEVKDISSLESSAGSQITQAIESELGDRNIKLGPGGLPVRVTLSEGSDGYIWVGEVEQGGVFQVAAVRLPRSTNSVMSPHAAPVLQKRMVWEQAGLFLDFFEKQFVIVPASVLTVLEPDRLAKYSGSGGRWGNFSPAGVIPFDSGSRDVRGRLIAPANGPIKVFVATISCANPPVLSCGDSPGQEWPVGDGWESHYTPKRNYFAGLSTDTTGIRGKQPGFFSLSRLEYDHGSDWLLAELDGKTRLYKGSKVPQAEFSGWGDDIASVKPACGSSWHVLVTGTGDWTQSDYVQLYEINDEQAVPIGQRLEFPGPILTLWSSDDKKSARVVSRNLHTGMYEASIVSVSCSD